jgi:hypothetical protein
MDFSWCSAPAKMLYNQLLEKWGTWEKCRRWYKWLSIIQLFIAYGLLFVSAVSFSASVTLIVTSSCCQGCGDAMGKTQWFDVDANGNASYSHTQDNGMWCKIVGYISKVAGFGCLLCCIVCYGGSWLFLALTFIFLYEEIDELAPIEYFTLTNKKECPKEMNLYKQMDRKKAKEGSVKQYEFIRGQHVYTGWIRTMDDEPLWLYCNRRGKMIFERFSTEEEVRLYIANAMTAREEVPGVLMATTPGSGDMRRVYPTNNVNSTRVGEPILAEGSVTSEPNTGNNVGGASPYASQEPTYEVEEV